MIMKNVTTNTGSILASLRQYLPYSTNAIHSVLTYPQKTVIYQNATENNSEIITSVAYNSGYNPHIWYSPIIWLSIGGVEKNEKLIAATLEYLADKFTSFISMVPKSITLGKLEERFKFYKENLMIRRNSQPPLHSPYTVRRLDSKDAMESLRLSSGIEPNDVRLDPVGAEKLFLKERETYGIFMEGKLVCRGSIMASSGSYYSVGGFVTDQEYRGMGLGTRIVDFICREVELRGGFPFLTVRSDNDIAIKLYKKLGFETLQEITFIDYNTGVVP